MISFAGGDGPFCYDTLCEMFISFDISRTAFAIPGIVEKSDISSSPPFTGVTALGFNDFDKR